MWDSEFVGGGVFCFMGDGVEGCAMLFGGFAAVLVLRGGAEGAAGEVGDFHGDFAVAGVHGVEVAVESVPAGVAAADAESGGFFKQDAFQAVGILGVC